MKCEQCGAMVDDPRIAELEGLLREANEVLWDFDIYRDLHERIEAALKEG